MDKNAQRLRIRNGDLHSLQIPLDKELFTKFKIQCIRDGITIKDKITKMIKSSLEHL